MKKLLFLLSALLLATCLFSGRVATQKITLNVQRLNTLKSSGNPPPATLNLPETGIAVWSDQSTSITCYSSKNDQKITAHINKKLPSHCSLYIQLSDPKKGKSLGFVKISTSPSDVYVNVQKGPAHVMPVQYRLEVDSTAPAKSLEKRVVTYTLTSM